MVHFVGAGPGAPDLITLRGDALLRRADMVIWAGSLVNPELLKVCREDCEILDSARMTLEEVLDAMERAERDGLEVVRLHTGDPSVYGAIQEQMDALRERGIPFDVVPGVSSFCGAAAALEQELTLPGISQTVMLTRLAGRTPMPAGEDMRSLAAHGSTLVIFLSAGHLERLQEELLAAGRSEREPAAIVYKATWPDEVVLRCQVGTLAKTGKEHGIRLTALVVVGRVLDASYERSRLYDPGFATLFRPAHDAGADAHVDGEPREPSSASPGCEA
ncbi:precorrin-4 C(11)-methyltransferase [Collinsella sp. An2]|uniref:precorrin-4 C(11)-methyltransferase n=1 Tax=Collinsella sp. An2 TaxID=1965585 RepID=UPI000B37CC9E|nr:precorrin-4 C(11)-methyltransferase [Collinsella sp. An2]OUP09145.1 precorrin-4 C(11)-methyltransferase [Collinsella sp. An2]